MPPFTVASRKKALTDRLTDVKYDAETAGELTEELVRLLRDAVKCNQFPL